MSTAAQPKAKKTAVSKKPLSHPPFVVMITEAIASLKERTGSSQYAITKFIEGKHKELPATYKKLVLLHLKKSVAAGKLVKVKNSFKLAAPVKSASTKTAASAPKKPSAVAKPAPKPKVAAPKKKPASKPKAKTAATAPKSKPKPKPAKVAAKKVSAKPAKKTPVKKPKSVAKKPKSVKSPAKKAKK